MEALQEKKKEEEIKVEKSSLTTEKMWSFENFLNGKCTDVLEA